MKCLACFLIIAILSLNLGAYCDEIKLENPDKLQIKYSEQVKDLKGSLFIEDSQTAQIIIDKQQEKDIEDIEMLWNATVEKNSVIKFSLTKLAIPEEQRRIHSSLMAKTASALISGASMLPSFLGMHYAIQSASYATARIANNFINKSNYDKLSASPLTDTEAIELATLIEELQNEIVLTYYNYKGALNKLKDCKSRLSLYNKNYSTALKNNDKLEIAISSALWDEQVIEEYKLTQEAKKYQLLLQRLAGEEAIENLNLVQFNLNTRNINVEDLDFNKKKIETNQEEEQQNIKNNDKQEGGKK
ncbi:MAG: hypothetical protein E7Z91_06840 [Cyanobacteria bacterium SIG30]|nr:hypothetical protein [Cyanobacteria bacterium SIG30]